MRDVSSEGKAFTSLSTEILRDGNSIRFKALGSSMLPWIKDGDMLTIQPITAERLQPGQVVFYTSAGERPIVHRILRLEKSATGRIVIARGDASPKSEEQVESSNILGFVTRIHRGSKVIHLDRNLWWRLSRFWPPFVQFTFMMLRFQRRFRRYIVLSPQNHDPGQGE